MSSGIHCAPLKPKIGINVWRVPVLNTSHSQPLHLNLRSLNISPPPHVAPALCAPFTSAPQWTKSSGTCGKVALGSSHWCYTALSLQPHSWRVCCRWVPSPAIQPLLLFTQVTIALGTLEKKKWVAAFGGCCQDHQCLTMSLRHRKEDTEGPWIYPYTFGLLLENKITKGIKNKPWSKTTP